MFDAIVTLYMHFRLTFANIVLRYSVTFQIINLRYSVTFGMTIAHFRDTLMTCYGTLANAAGIIYTQIIRLDKL